MHTHGDDLGLRLRGEQLAAGVRFVRMIREETYDLVVGNPPYQGTAKMADSTVRAEDLCERVKRTFLQRFSSGDCNSFVPEVYRLF
jgi:hypothetical protein